MRFSLVKIEKTTSTYDKYKKSTIQVIPQDQKLFDALPGLFFFLSPPFLVSFSFSSECLINSIFIFSINGNPLNRMSLQTRKVLKGCLIEYRTDQTS